jgi:hypothetical protein
MNLVGVDRHDQAVEIFVGHDCSHARMQSRKLNRKTNQLNPNRLEAPSSSFS